MKFKKGIILLIFVLLISVFTTACGDEKPSISVYNWGDYIDNDVLREFEEEYDVKVIYDMFETNEDMYIKLKQGGGSYDLAFPSDYMIERMIREDMLVKLDKENIPNLEKVDEAFLDLDFDPHNDYSVPYMWGTVGIIYNTTMVDEEVDSWDILWNEKYTDEIFMLNSQRDTIAVALKKLGYSMNTRNLDELEEAKNILIQQKPLVSAYLGDDIKGAMISGEAALAVVWSGDAVYMMRENPDLNYIIPKEGTNKWFDNMVIPKNSENKEMAEKFINFMCRPDIAAKNTDYIGYSTPIPEAIEMLPDDIKNSQVAYPSQEMIKDAEIFKDPTDIIEVYDTIWTEITSAR